MTQQADYQKCCEMIIQFWPLMVSLLSLPWKFLASSRESSQQHWIILEFQEPSKLWAKFWIILEIQESRKHWANFWRLYALSLQMAFQRMNTSEAQWLVCTSVEFLQTFSLIQKIASLRILYIKGIHPTLWYDALSRGWGEKLIKIPKFFIDFNSMRDTILSTASCLLPSFLSHIFWHKNFVL